MSFVYDIVKCPQVKNKETTVNFYSGVFIELCIENVVSPVCAFLSDAQNYQLFVINILPKTHSRFLNASLAIFCEVFNILCRFCCNF